MGLLNFFRIRNLKSKYRMLYGVSKEEAEKSLQRQMNFIKMKRPGQSEEWYMQKIVYDLEKDRN
jgi:hypothetical protein